VAKVRQFFGRGSVKRSLDVGVLVEEPTCAAQLARFFPLAQRVRLAARITVARNSSARLQEAVLVEFCGREHAIFVSSLPLEFDDRVALQREGRDGTKEASVVAVQYHEGRKAVAVRFSQGACDWVTQP
jgi:hypothetical protein